MVGKCPYPAFAQNDLMVALGHDIFCRHQKLFYGCRHAPLEQDRFGAFAGPAQQGKVLHIAGPDLDNICHLLNLGQVIMVNRFSYNEQACLGPHLG